MKNINLMVSNILKIFCALSLLLLINGCTESFEFELPESNSQIDTELPNADFAAVQDVIDFKVYQFQGLDLEATNFDWEFGDGGTANVQDPLYTFEGGEGTYSVTLTTSDANGANSTITKDVVVIEPEAPSAFVPPILEASFEDGQLEGESGDGRDSWRNSDLGGVIQITSSPVLAGDQAAKFPAEGDRIAYQELEVTANADYKITFFYTLKTDTPGSITVDVLAGGGYASVSGAEILGSTTGADQDDSGTYVEATVAFNSGANTLVSMYVHNVDTEARMDLVSIEVVE